MFLDLFMLAPFVVIALVAVAAVFVLLYEAAQVGAGAFVGAIGVLFFLAWLMTGAVYVDLNHQDQPAEVACTQGAG